MLFSLIQGFLNESFILNIIVRIIYLSRRMSKPTKLPVCPAKTQISLGICPVWSASSLSAWGNLGSLATHWAHSEDIDQTAQMPRLIWVFAWRTCHFVGFVMLRLISYFDVQFKFFAVGFIQSSKVITGAERTHEISSHLLFWCHWHIFATTLDGQVRRAVTTRL